MGWRERIPVLVRPGALPGILQLVLGVPWLYRKLWRGVELGGDIDFIASMVVRWPGMSEFLAEWGWLLLIATGFAWLTVYVHAVRHHKSLLPKINLQRVLGCTAALTAVAAAFFVGRSFPYVGSILELWKPIHGWSVVAKPNLRIRLDMRLDPLSRFSDDYWVRAVCRAADKTKRFMDSRHVFTESLSIRDEMTVEIEIPEWLGHELCVYGEFQCTSFLIDKQTSATRAFHQSIRKGIRGDIKCIPSHKRQEDF